MAKGHSTAGMVLAAAILWTAFSGPAGAGTVWREGEDASVQSVQRHPWWYDKVKADRLSGGKWMSHFSDKKAGEVTYDVAVVEAGDYAFWVRANPVACKLSFRLDDGAWKEISFDGATGQVNIAADDKPDLRFIAWVQAGRLRLTKGDHTLRFRFEKTKAPQHHGGLDVFVLTTEPFTPRGVARPGRSSSGAAAAPKAELDESNSWAFTPSVDPFNDDALLDLRGLNEKVAGESGFVKLSPDGSGFVDGRGRPMRLFCTLSDGSKMKPADMERHFRHLAKLGVNMVRLHTNVAVWKEGAAITDVNDKQIDGILRAVAVAKKNGIYTVLSPFWAFGATPRSWGLEGMTGKKPLGVMFYHPRLQNAYKTWVRELYTRKNPVTGVPLTDEPALAVIQVKNEDSMLFYTMQSLPPVQQRILNEQYGTWLIDKYGSLVGAREAWKGVSLKDDDFDASVAGMYITWHLTQPAKGGMQARLADQLEFLAWRQRKFYQDIHDFYRKELGCKQLTNAMNWRPADKLLLDDAERYSYMACDVIAVNRYTGGVHKGQNDGWRIDPGHFLVNRTILKRPLELPTNLKQVAGRPFLITETAWVRPNLYQSEGVLMGSAYQCLNGVDGVFWFAASNPDWLREPRMTWTRVGPGHPINKWSCATPAVMGMFPANALIVRNGYVRQGATVVHERRSLADMWQRKPPLIAETESFDTNRDVKDLRDQAAGKTAVSRLAFLVGPVEVAFGEKAAPTKVADLSPYIDGDKQTVRSNTGELELSWGAGLFRVDTPCAQAVTGFLKDAGGQFALRDVTIESDNDYATIEVVSMDRRPLKTAARALVQVGTVCRLTGWSTRADSMTADKQTLRGERIVTTGRPPYRVKNTRVTLTVRNPSIRKAVQLDAGGYRKADLPVERVAGGVKVALPADAMWVMLSAE